MQPTTTNEAGWKNARFPGRVGCEEFLGHVKLWNRIEDLPSIETRTLPDGRSVSYLCRDYRNRGLGLLIESYGGEVTPLEADRAP